MTTLTDILDGFVKKIKENEEFSHVRFVHAGKVKGAEKPVTDFLVACAVEGVKVSKEQRDRTQCAVQLEFTIYAPFNKGSREHSQLSHALVGALYSADTEGRITEIELKSGVYDSDMDTLRRTVTAQVVLLKEQEDGSVPDTEDEDIPSADIEIDGKLCSGVVSFRATATPCEYEIKELLAGDTGVRVSYPPKYDIRIAVRTQEDPFENLKDFSLRLACEGSKIYEGCTVTETQEKLELPQGILREYTILAKSAT